MNTLLSNGLVLLVCFVSCSGFFMTPHLHEGDLTPIDPEVCVSQNITFKCTLLSPPDHKHKIGFAIKTKANDRRYIRAVQDLINVISETMAELTVYNITSRMYVRCIYGETSTDVDVAKSLGHTSTVLTYPMPEKVDGIECIVDNYYSSMNCSWNYSSIYKRGHYPEVMFQWRIPELSASWTDCPDLNTRYGFCHWKNTRVGDFSMKVIDVQITNKQPCGINVSSTFRIDTTQIVRPYPVIDLTSSVINSTCVIVQYRTGTSERLFPKELRILISSKWNKEDEMLFSTPTIQTIQSKTVCNLHPYTEYTFSVSVHPIGRHAGYFSRPRTTQVSTYPDIPSSSPTVAEGGFSVNARDCKEGETERHICIPMKPVKAEDENGPMEGIVISRTSNETGHTFEEEFNEDLTYACLSSLLCNTSYMISINARNVKGISAYDSSLFIPAIGLVIPPLDIKVEAGEDTGEKTNVYLSWTPTEYTNSYMAFWCRNRNGDCAKSNEVDWKNFPMNSTEGVIQIENAYFPQDFLYGVSAQTETGSSGIKWQECVYLRNTLPKREPKNVIVSEGSDDKTIVVTWDKLMCKSDEPYIELYNVRYRKLNEDKYKSVNISSMVEARVIIDDLEYDQSYVVTVRGVTKQGHNGPESQPNTVKIKQNAPMCELLELMFSQIQCAIQSRQTGESISDHDNDQSYHVTASEVTGHGHFGSGTLKQIYKICNFLKHEYSMYKCGIQSRGADGAMRRPENDQYYSVTVNEVTEQGFVGNGSL